MREKNHTPGPWAIFNDGKCVSGPESTPGAGNGVAMCSMRARSDKESRANARLIAAAPELLDALSWLVRRLAAKELNASDEIYLDQARAAIAKVEGQS